MLAKSKLNSIETLVSQALIVMEISHTEFITILKEKDKYEQMKENVRNLSEKLEEKQENMRLNRVNLRKISLETCDLHHQKSLFFSCVYIKWLINKETYEDNGIESIVDGIGTLWLNEKHIEEKLGHKSLPAITNKYDQRYKKRRHDLVNNPKKQSNRKFLHSNLVLKIIMDCRTDKS